MARGVNFNFDASAKKKKSKKPRAKKPKAKGGAGKGNAWRKYIGGGGKGGDMTWSDIPE